MKICNLLVLVLALLALPGCGINKEESKKIAQEIHKEEHEKLKLQKEANEKAWQEMLADFNKKQKELAAKEKEDEKRQKDFGKMQDDIKKLQEASSMAKEKTVPLIEIKLPKDPEPKKEEIKVKPIEPEKKVKSSSDPIELWVNTQNDFMKGIRDKASNGENLCLLDLKVMAKIKEMDTLIYNWRLLNGAVPPAIGTSLPPYPTKLRYNPKDGKTYADPDYEAYDRQIEALKIPHVMIKAERDEWEKKGERAVDLLDKIKRDKVNKKNEAVRSVKVALSQLRFDLDRTFQSLPQYYRYEMWVVARQSQNQ